MSKKILVTYATRAGSTAGVAQAIGSTLAQYKAAVDVRPMAEVIDLSEYGAVIAGSAVRMDHWLPEAQQFVAQHQRELAKMPFAAFVVCLAMSTQNDKRREAAKATASGYLKSVRELVPTVSEGLFAGVLDLSRLPLRYRLPFSLLTLTGVFREGDYRDWDAIERWAKELVPLIGFPELEV